MVDLLSENLARTAEPVEHFRYRVAPGAEIGGSGRGPSAAGQRTGLDPRGTQGRGHHGVGRASPSEGQPPATQRDLGEGVVR
jgi:hypothetical protein